MRGNERDRPGDRPWEPEHPMSLEGGTTRGDPVLMLRCLCEEFLLNGTSANDLRAMTRDQRYGAFAAVLGALGPERTDDVVEEAIARVGTCNARTREARSLPDCLQRRVAGGGE